MKNLVTTKEENWIWPIADENSWYWQNQNKDLHKIIMPHVPNKRVMVQAGGNCGFMLDTFVPYFEHLYTFEPDPINFYCLNQNVTSQKVTKLQACIGEHNNPLNTQQLIREDRPHDTGGVHVNGAGNTPAISIDTLNLSNCDLIQLDVEGYELKALKGSINTIKKYKPVICVELCEKWLNRYGDTTQDVLNFFDTLNYKQVDSCGVDIIFVPN